MGVATADPPIATGALTPELPPGPDWSLPRMTWRWWKQPLETLEACQARYGDMFTIRLPHEGTWVFVSDPEAVRQVFTGDPNLLHAGAANIVLLPVLGEHSVLLLDEPEHMAQRKLMLPPFHGKRMQAYREVMARAAAEEIERLPTDFPVRMRPRMQAVTLEVILRAVFGIDEGERLVRLRDELRSTLNLLSNPRRAIFLVLLGPERLRRLPWFRRKLERVDRLLFEEISMRRGAYLDAVIKETLRLRPVVALVLRKLVEPMEIGGRLLPAGASVAPSIYLVHRRPDVYPDPERFRPERFLEQPPGTYTWIPFGGGVRRCLGGAFAEFEMSVVLRELVSRRALRPAGGPPEHSVRSTITNVPSRGAEVIAASRTS
jgi:cytochrome P450